jgi:hypothetical protein
VSPAQRVLVLDRAHDTNLKATLRRSTAQVKREIHRGALLTGPPANLSGTYALPASATATESNLKNRPRRTAVWRRSPSALRHASIGACERPGQLPRRYHGRRSRSRASARSWSSGPGVRRYEGRGPGQAPADRKLDTGRKASRFESRRARRPWPGAPGALAERLALAVRLGREASD